MSPEEQRKKYRRWVLPGDLEPYRSNPTVDFMLSRGLELTREMYLRLCFDDPEEPRHVEIEMSIPKPFQDPTYCHWAE